MDAAHLDPANPAPGIYHDVPMAVYLATEALSASPVRKLLEECPKIGWWHSRLNPQRPHEVSKEMDVGSAAHSVLLEDSWDCVVQIDPANYPAKNGNIPAGWTNENIREARDVARMQGKYPVLLGGIAPIQRMVDAAKEYIASLQHTEPAIWRAFQPDGGHSETVIVWDEGGVLCKLRTDRAANDWTVVCDYKTSAMSVDPARFGRNMLSGMGYNFGAAWYRRGIRALTGVESTYVFLAQETDAPHLCSLPGLDPTWISIGDEQVESGINQWRRCLAANRWPGYPPRVIYPDVPVWKLAEHEAAQQAGGHPYDYADLTGRAKPEFLK